MISVGKWRWPIAVTIPLVVGGLLVWQRVVRLTYQGQAVLAYSGRLQQMDLEPKFFQTHPTANVVFEKVPGQPLQVAVRAEGSSPEDVVKRLEAVGDVLAKQSLTRQKAELKPVADRYRRRVADLEASLQQQLQSQKTPVSAAKPAMPRAHAAGKIAELTARRRLLIEKYPTHTDIPLLGQQIKDLTAQLKKPAPVVREKPADLGRTINETKVRKDYYAQQVLETIAAERALKPTWKIVRPVLMPKRPLRVEGWPIGAGSVAGLFIFGFAFLKGKKKGSAAASNGLWRPAAPEAPVELTVVAPDSTEVASAAPESALPSDPMTEKAAALYRQWVQLAKILYEPAREAPQGVLDQVAPLLQESSDFLVTGHDVLARYLARSVTSGDLPAHVARTVLMTLTGAQEAKVSPEHRLGMALAALFHDLAVVPRPAGVQEEAGSEVGRLSASVLRRIPGLQPALLSMVEEILIGMDEFKLETWQNVANGSNLESLSKVLREIDRFEKVMQKQQARLDRRIANQ